MILIQDGYMIDPKSGKEGNFDILIDGDKIVKIAEKIEPKGKVTRINAEGLLVAPGLVDVHVHFRDPGFTAKEDINTGAAAAAKGGVTTVVLMANTKPTVDSEETLKYILDKGAKTGIHVTTCANVTMGMQGKQLTDMKKLAAAGAVGFTDVCPCWMRNWCDGPWKSPQSWICPSVSMKKTRNISRTTV